MIYPSRGDLIWLDFDPQAGREQAGRRPAIVLSEFDFNRLTGIAVVCPVTNRKKGYAFEVLLPEDSPIAGVVLTDQIKSLDMRKRRFEIVGRLQPESVCFKAVIRNVRSIFA